MYENISVPIDIEALIESVTGYLYDTLKEEYANALIDQVRTGNKQATNDLLELSAQIRNASIESQSRHRVSNATINKRAVMHEEMDARTNRHNFEPMKSTDTAVG